MPPFRDIPRWFLLGILVFAPWAYGSTRPWTLDLLRWLLVGLAALFVLSLVVERRRPRIAGWAAGLAAAILGLGWWMTLNARAVFDPVGPQFHDVGAWVAWLPGTMDQGRSLSFMLLATGMMGAFATAADMLTDAKWRNRLWVTVALVGVSLIFFGVIQRLSGARAIFWVWGDRTGRTFFATFRYHANAGAFINLVTPFIVGRVLLAFRQEAGHAGKVFWCLASFVAVAAAFLNVSRAAMVITMFLLAVFAVWWFFTERERREVHRPRMRWLAPTAVILAISLLAYAFGLERSITRWIDSADNLINNLRYQVYDIIWDQTLPAVGWGGSGPGTFELVFPLSIKAAQNEEVGRWYWMAAHEDYLQTLVEWGVLGGILWGALILGGMTLGCVRLLRPRAHLSSETRYLLVSACLALLGVCLHSLVDFPLQIGSLQLYTAVACAVVWMVGRTGSDQRVRRRRRVPPAEANET
ncbi:MAG: hypothetical protein BGO12_07320 [Verrucomicrobia bacterium 61-8]|nr:O-antigen ligase family protein [Verrucomicrobiota bacterium]OJV03869.1 MAG: hypothetical protein BGO12_07320 [Verrucomicrobia bacterium 61-8]